IRGAYAESPAWLRPLIGPFDTLTNWWRWWVLTARPAWIANNTVGNVIFSTLNGVAPRHYLMALQEQFRAKTPDALNGIHLSASEADLGLLRHGGGPLGDFLNWLDQKPTPVGLWDALRNPKELPGAAMRGVRVAKYAADRATEFVNGINQGIERYFRTANYIK